MRIEKLSETQIRCTLNKKDLSERELKISELAYGTEKTKQLFRDMMMQASYEFGFEADDIPLMIEAIPTAKDTLVLVITKVEDPDELDTRFSRFSPDYSDGDEDEEEGDAEPFTDEILQCFDQLNELLQDKKTPEDNFIPLPEVLGLNKKNEESSPVTKAKETPSDVSKIFLFTSLNDVIQLAEQVVSIYHGKNYVYKNPVTGVYYLILHKSSHTTEEFAKICNVVSEYGKLDRASYATSSYFKEHFECIVKSDALQILSVM